MQLDGKLMSLIPFGEILMSAYKTPDVYYAASKLSLAAPASVGNGVFNGTSIGIGNTARSAHSGRVPSAPAPAPHPSHCIA